jgi:hypothetical protein
MKKISETFEVAMIMQGKDGYRVVVQPEDRAASKLGVSIRTPDAPELAPGQKLRVTVEVVSE